MNRRSDRRMLAALSCALAAPLSAQAPAPPAPPPAGSPAQVGITWLRGEARKPVPFELVKGVIVFRAQVNGHDVWAVLDNRMGTSVISDALVAASDVATAPLPPLTTPSGTVPRRRVEAVTVVIPGQGAFRGPIGAVNLDVPSRVAGRPIDLMIGAEYFSNLEFLILTSTRTFALGPSGSLTIPPFIKPIPLASARPTVATTLAGMPMTLTMDLGFAGSVALGEAAWRRVGALGQALSGGTGTDLSGRLTRSESAALPAFELGAERIGLVKVLRRPVLADDGDGMLGTGILLRYNLALDEKAGRMWILPPEMVAGGDDRAPSLSATGPASPPAR